MTGENRIGKQIGKRGMVGLGVCLLLSVWLLAGCGAYKKAAKQTRKVKEALSFSDRLIKKVAVLPYGNQTFLRNKNASALFDQHLLALFASDCSEVILLKPGNPGYPNGLKNPPRLPDGRPDSLAMAEIGEKSGINIIVHVGLLALDAAQRGKGILMFRDMHYFGISHMEVIAFDTATGTKILDETFSRETEVDGVIFDEIRARKTSGVQALQEIMEDMAGEAAEKLCAKVRELPWSGFVTAVEEGRAVLSAGKEAGLAPEMILDVYARGEIVKGTGGQRFHLPGKKIGEAVIESVRVGGARLRAEEGTVIPRGGRVRLR